MKIFAEQFGKSGWEVPDHSVIEFRGKGTAYCICICVVNEGPRLLSQLGKMREVGKCSDIIIADGGSTDGSVEADTLRNVGVRSVLIMKGGPGLSAQMRMGFAYCLQEGYRGIITIDGNDKDEPGAVRAFKQALEEGYDHVQGSRFIKGGVALNTPRLRLAAIKLIHAPMISVAAGFRYTDTTNGFRAYSARFLTDPRVAPFRAIFTKYELHYYLAIQAPRLGFRVREVPVTRRYPEQGNAPTKISPVKGSLLILWTLLKTCLLSQKPRGRRSASNA